MQTMKYHIFFNFGKPPKRMMANTMREEARGKEKQKMTVTVTMISAHAHTRLALSSMVRVASCTVLFTSTDLPYTHDGDQKGPPLCHRGHAKIVSTCYHFAYIRRPIKISLSMVSKQSLSCTTTYIFNPNEDQKMSGK